MAAGCPTRRSPRMGPVTLVVLALATARGDWEANSIVSISRSMARADNLTDCWICHSNPLAGDRHPAFVPFEGNVTLTLLRQRDAPNRVPLRVNLPLDASLPCVHLKPPLVLSAQRPLPRVTVPLRCYRDSASCCHCSLNKPARPACVPPRQRGARSAAVAGVTPLFDQVPCSPNLTHWCPGSPDAHGRCLLWSGPALPAAPGSGCARSPPWGPQLEAWLGRGAEHRACAPAGFAFLCRTRDSTVARACLGATAEASQKCILARVELRGAAPTVLGGARDGPARLGAGIPEGSSAAARLAVPGAGYASQEATLGSLATSLRDLAPLAGKVLELQRSAGFLADMIRENQLSLDYFLAEQGGVCVLVNATCCTYVDSRGEVETDAERLAQQASRLLQDAQDPDPEAGWTAVRAWLPPVLSLLVSLSLILGFGLFLFRSAVKTVHSTIQQFQEKLMEAQKYKPLLSQEPALSALSPRQQEEVTTGDLRPKPSDL